MLGLAVVSRRDDDDEIKVGHHIKPLAAIAGAALKGLWDIHKAGGIAADMQMPFLAGTLVSAVLGAVVIAFFLRYLRRNSLMPFIYYRIIFGIIVIALAVFFRFTAE